MTSSIPSLANAAHTSSGKISAWSHIAETLASAIAQGQFAPGQKLPSEHNLAQEFGVNRHTVRKSLASLCRQGLLRVTQGSGTYVEEFAVDLMINRRSSHHQSLALAGLKGGLQVLSEQTLRANTQQAKSLQVPVRSALLKLTILGEAQGRPLHFSERLFPLPRFQGLAKVIEATGSISAGFKSCGVLDYHRTESRVSAHMPSEVVALHLRQPVSRPVLWVESTNVDQSGSPIESASTWFAGDRVKLTVNHKE
jgi:GntR family phosphonate transport system transcriptional regulator